MFFSNWVTVVGGIFFTHDSQYTPKHRCKKVGKRAPIVKPALTIAKGPTHIGQEALLQIRHTHHTVDSRVRNVFLEAIMVSNSHYVALVWSMRISNFKCVRVSG